MSPAEAAQAFLQISQQFQRRNAYIADAHGLSLSLLESHILVELDADPNFIAKDLAELLATFALLKCQKISA